MKYEIVDTVCGQHALKPSLQGLFVDCFQKPLPDDWWNFLYLGCGNSPAISVAAWDDEGLAGHYAASSYPVRNSDGEELRIARGMTLAVAERARAQGVLKHLLDHIKPALLDHGLLWTMGFPNDHSWKPLVLFCGWKILNASPQLIFDVEDGPSLPIEEKAILLPSGFAPPYGDPCFTNWRNKLREFKSFSVDHSIGVVAKILNGDTLDVMDAWPTMASPAPSALFALARHESLPKICITEEHARQIGMEMHRGRPVGYTVRQAAMKNGAEPLPTFRFSLLFSDVY